MKSYFFYTDQLTVGYDGKPLIKEINIQLNKGEILTLIGPNGLSIPSGWLGLHFLPDVAGREVICYILNLDYTDNQS